jgi:hypothetical protein
MRCVAATHGMPRAVHAAPAYAYTPAASSELAAAYILAVACVQGMHTCIACHRGAPAASKYPTTLSCNYPCRAVEASQRERRVYVGIIIIYPYTPCQHVSDGCIASGLAAAGRVV